MSAGPVSITELSIPDLQKLAYQFEQKIQFISASIQQLKSLQSQFALSKGCLKEFTPETKDSDILVPLTSTLCVPGKLSDTNTSVKDAEEHFNRRIEYINKQIKKIMPILEEKTQVHKSISATLDTKIQELVRARSNACS